MNDADLDDKYFAMLAASERRRAAQARDLFIALILAPLALIAVCVVLSVTEARHQTPAALQIQGNVYAPVGLRVRWCRAQNRCEVARR